MESAYYILNAHLPKYTWPLLGVIFFVSLALCLRIGKAETQGRNGIASEKPDLRYKVLCERFIKRNIYIHKDYNSVQRMETIKNGGEKWKSAIVSSLFITYISAILFATLIFRTPAGRPFDTAFMKAEWAPFWSWYEVIVNHNVQLKQEIVLNVLLFVPFGFLLCLRYPLRVCTAFLCGFLLSASIETLQLLTCRGLFEWDDMIGNGLGCLIGFCIARVMQRLWAAQ